MNINTMIFGETWLEKVVVTLGKHLQEDVLINRVNDLQEAKTQLENNYDLFVLDRATTDKIGTENLTSIVKTAKQEPIVMIAEDETMTGAYIFDQGSLNYLKLSELADWFLSKLIKTTKEKHKVQEDLFNNTEIFNLAEILALTGGWKYDFEKRCLEVTQGLLDIFGLEQDTNNCLAIFDLKVMFKAIDKEYRLKLYPLLRVCYEQKKSISFEMIIFDQEGKKKWVRLAAVPKSDLAIKNSMPTRLMGGIMDISREKNFQQHLEQKSLTDSLTGLKNRIGFFTFEQESRVLAKRNEQMMFFMYAKLNNLEEIKQYYNEASMDKIIISFSELLKKSYRESDLLATFEKGEFVVLGNLKGAAQKDGLLSRLLANVKLFNKESEVQIDFNYGIEIFSPKYIRDMEGLMKKAEKEMSHQKSGTAQDNLQSVLAYFRTKD